MASSTSTSVRQRSEVLNFSAGPAVLPEEVLLEAQRDMLNWNGSGMSVMELNHRGPQFEKILNDAIANLRTLLAIPDNFKILFLQGGATTQFAAIPLNLFGAGEGPHVADYIVTGYWSEKAAKEASKYGHVHQIRPPTFTAIPSLEGYKPSANASYVYLCANETIHGVEWSSLPQFEKPLVVDASSDFLSRKIDFNKASLVIAGAQKNAGSSGVTIVIVKDSLLQTPMSVCPDVLDYKIMAAQQSMLNTPPTWSIYISGLVFKWMLAKGGVEEFDKLAEEKSSLFYNLIQDSPLYCSSVDPASRSRMNIPLRIKSQGMQPGFDEALEKKFLAQAKARGMEGLNGHRLVGGLRLSLYNALPMEHVEELVRFMVEFEEAHEEQPPSE